MAYDTNKLTKLSHLKQLAQKVANDCATKVELSTLSKRVDDLVTAGGEPNVITAIKVNGVEQTVSDKAVDISVPGYSIVKDESSGDYAAVYHMTKDGQNVGAAINIPKDMVVESGEVVENPEGQAAGTYIKLVLQNVADPLFINVGNLIEYVTSGSAEGDMVVVVIDETTHKVTANITDGTITKAKLHADVQTELNKAHEHTNKALLDTYDQTNDDLKDAVTKKHSHANAEELAKFATGDKEKLDQSVTKLATIAEGATKVEASTTAGAIKINGVDTTVVSIATDAEVTEMLTEVFPAAE